MLTMEAFRAWCQRLQIEPAEPFRLTMTLKFPHAQLRASASIHGSLPEAVPCVS